MEIEKNTLGQTKKDELKQETRETTTQMSSNYIEDSKQDAVVEAANKFVKKVKSVFK